MEAAVMKLREVSSVTSPILCAEQEAFIKQYDALPVQRIEDIAQSTTSPALCSIDKQAMIMCIASSLADYLNFVGLGRKMNDKQLYDTAELMIDAHPNLPVDTIKAFAKACKKGAFGYHYDEMNGTKLLMWFDKYAQEYYKQVDDYEYSKHQSTKGDLANPANLTDEDGEPIDVMQLLASFHGKTKEQLERERLVKDIRYNVFKKHMHLYNEMPIEEADKIVEKAIIDEMKANNLSVF